MALMPSCFANSSEEVGLLSLIWFHTNSSSETSSAAFLFAACQQDAFPVKYILSSPGVNTHGVVAYLCIVSIKASMYRLLACVRLKPLCESQASHLSRSLCNSSSGKSELELGRSITPSTSPSIACL